MSYENAPLRLYGHYAVGIHPIHRLADTTTVDLDVSRLAESVVKDVNQALGEATEFYEAIDDIVGDTDIDQLDNDKASKVVAGYHDQFEACLVAAYDLKPKANELIGTFDDVGEGGAADVMEAALSELERMQENAKRLTSLFL